MRLKSLAIKGFKSFANETIINFQEDVIGIVGPNGSGKSNIVDAIRWVLGEQKSKELRLEKMSNIIFNGTKKRKPSGLASVSLTFENTKNILPTEYQTVTISRILYRSGESEYRLNNVPCRLKDITSLFLDTGIGSNSYAIIALGMVDDLLQDKDNSRRKMFEQAAGISKYKRRKHETLNKLKNTTEDLDRVEDLLFEIDGNLKQLEKQAKRTKRYYELKEKYKEHSVSLASIKLSSYKGDHQELEVKLRTEEDALLKLDTELRQLEASLESEKKQNLDKEKMLSDSQKAVNESDAALRDMESDKRVFKQKFEFLEQDKGKLGAEIESANERIGELKVQVENYETSLDQEKIIEAENEQKFIASKEALDKVRSQHGNLQSELEAHVQNQQSIDKEVFELEKNKAISLNQIENHVAETNLVLEQVTQKRSEISDFDKVIEQQESEKLEVTERLEALEQAETKRQASIMANETKLESIRKELSDINRSLDAKRNEYKLTKSMVENLEGFPESIKFLSKNKSWSQNATLLSDIIYCDPDYRVAIEAYLEPYLNYYVADTLKDAFAGVNLLGKSQKGKANFFVLESIPDSNSSPTLIGGTIRALDKVKIDQKYKNLFHHLLGNVFITEQEHVDSTLIGGDSILLSNTGRFVQRKFSLSGGSVGLFEGKKIGRKKNLEVLEVAINKLEAEEKRLNIDFQKVKEQLFELKKNISNEEIKKERSILNRIEQELVTFKTRKENIDQFIRDADSRKLKAEVAINHLQQIVAEVEVAWKTKKEEEVALRENVKDKDEAFRKVADELSLASNAYNQNNIEFIRQQNKVQGLEKELEYRETQLAEFRNKITANNEAISKSIVESDEMQSAIKELEAQLLEGYEKRKALEGSLTAAEQNYFQARGGISELEDNVKTKTRARTKLVEVIQSLKDRFNQMKLELTSISERLRIEFNIDINEVLKQEKEEDENIDLEELESKVTKLKKRLDNYGEINPMAVEAYDEMKIRFDSITAQRNDILEAKGLLLETIKEIEDSATSQFLEAFEKARGYFIEVFRTLFTEDDHCDLILEDPENPLDSKIKIIAKPKGKRPLTINQLSGGEKTLTATALLFALYLLKPAPFCVFDEVDAPLDDANIEKFNKIVRKFSQESQFIIVTHNKATMAAVDTIYGVFMQDMGVSDVAAVDFRELENTATLVTA